MKRKLLLLLFTLTIFTMTACSSSDHTDADSDDTSISDESSVSDESYGTVTLCDYKNLAAQKNIYEVTEDDINERIEYLTYDYIEYNEVNRPSENGDCLTVNMTASINGEVILDYTDEEGYDIYLGYEEFGTDFDEKLTGVSTGDELSFTLTHDEDFSYSELAGSTVDYAVTVLSITVEIVPEITDEFITDTLGYESREAFEASLKQEAESEYESNSSYELRENLLQQVIDNSAFENYSQELYDSYAASIQESYESYASMFGYESVEEIYELFGMTEEDVEADVLNYVYRTIAVHAISDAENITLSDEEYQTGLENYVTDYGYEDTDSLLADYGEASIREWLLEEKVLDFLEENATITEVAASLDSEELE